jgi:enoyl-CoA hydratase/carnithine racemase
MLLTGRTVTASEAVAWGLVARTAAHEEVPAAAREALEWCARGAPSARDALKRVLEGQYGRYDRMTMDASLASAEVREGFRAFRERRNPAWVPDDLRTEGRL